MPQGLKRKSNASTRSVSPPKSRCRLSPSVQKPPSVSAVRIFSWNVNGVQPLLQKKISFERGNAFPLREFLKRHQWPHFLCLQEVKINPKDASTKRHLQHAANFGGESSEPTYTAHFSLPRDKYNATGFGGRVHGVASLIRDDLNDGLLSTWLPDWDLEGRVLVHEIDFGGHTVAIINGYWVNGTTNPYHNIATGAVEGTRHDHKLKFHAHMLELAQSMDEENKSVILVGDMNVARSEIDSHPNLRTSPIQHIKNRADFEAKFFKDSNGLQAIDVFRQIHGNLKKYTYHPRGYGWGQSCDRVDNILVTGKLFKSGAISSTDICDNPQDRGHSDHVPLWVEMDVSRLPR